MGRYGRAAQPVKEAHTMELVTTLLSSKYAIHVAELGVTTGIMVALFWETDRELAVTLGILAGFLALSGDLSALPVFEAGLSTRVNTTPELFLIPMAVTAVGLIGSATLLRYWVMEHGPAGLERKIRAMEPNQNN